MLPLLLACHGADPKDAGSTGPGDADADSDADADADADADTDADTDPTPTDTGPPKVDLDLDGLDDAAEIDVATRYLPFLSISPDDGCTTMGIVFRLRPHPLDPTKVHVIYALLYDIDCGADGHVGDDEVFAMTADPYVPPPAGILALRAIAHQDTPCGKVTDCDCTAAAACETAAWNGDDWPVVYASVDKHGSYLFEGVCDGACFFTSTCDLAPTPPTPMLVNAGEPDAPLTNDLTAAGLITKGNGWTSPELFGFDPWGPANFGGAGVVSSDLTDPGFDTPIPTCGP